ncbi:hypothetical protein [Pandoraea sputorum]|uniref:hypothetical protein n=1 Tax=Pandoraea sputorum TaxID=93222 RepID=UPI00177D211A|nr:hypothetical protein [Pandoraea sputorum]
MAARPGLSFTVILAMMLALAALAVLRVHGIERTLTNISNNSRGANDLAHRAAEMAEQGDDMVEQVVTTMSSIDTSSRKIVARVKQVSNAMDEISAASHGQKQRIEEVNRAIALMDQVTSRNAALVEDAGAAAQMLQRQAQAPTLSVGRFQLEATGANNANAAITRPSALP